MKEDGPAATTTAEAPAPAAPAPPTASLKKDANMWSFGFLKKEEPEAPKLAEAPKVSTIADFSKLVKPTKVQQEQQERIPSVALNLESEATDVQDGCIRTLKGNFLDLAAPGAAAKCPESHQLFYGGASGRNITYAIEPLFGKEKLAELREKAKKLHKLHAGGVLSSVSSPSSDDDGGAPAPSGEEEDVLSFLVRTWLNDCDVPNGDEDASDVEDDDDVNDDEKGGKKNGVKKDDNQSGEEGSEGEDINEDDNTSMNEEDDPFKAHRESDSYGRAIAAAAAAKVESSDSSTSMSL